MTASTLEREPAMSATAPAAVMVDDTPTAIGMPDRRVRVFISSTLQELSAERQAAREAVLQLRMTPVMFELGARSHSPRELYRAYLAHSDVFVGLYWQQYGWVAPGESVSGLEDEYALAGSRPRLIYVKTPAPDRDSQLSALLTRVREDDHTSYKRFSSADELANLLADDLAVLFTERFTAAVPEPQTPRAGRLPVPPSAMFGRDDDINAVVSLLRRPDVRLVTLTGPGGIGKTRLALAAAAGAAEHVDDTFFVDLAPVSDPEEVPAAIAAAVGVRSEGNRPVLDVLIDRLDGRHVLLVLDNVEQLQSAAVDLAGLLAMVPELQVLATSRTVLSLRGEHQYPLTPLPTPREEPTVPEAAASDAVRLFVARAQEARPNFELSPENAATVAAICRRLDGIPLAIELAAAQVRLLTPQVLLNRLGARLDLTNGHADLPARQRTLRATIDWSYNLLDPCDQVLLDRLSVFSSSWTLGGAQTVAADRPDAGTPGDADLLDRISTLVTHSLVTLDDRATSEPRFGLLDTVREYARERLADRGETAATVGRLAAYLRALASAAGAALLGSDNRAALSCVDTAADDLRAVIRWSITHDDAETAIGISAPLFTYWWSRGQLAPMLALADKTAKLPSAASLPPHAAVLLLWAQAMLRVALGRTDEAVPLLRRLTRDATDLGNERLLAHAQTGLGLALPYETAAAEARQLLDAAVATFRRLDDVWGVAFSLLPRGEIALCDGDVAAAEAMHRESLAMAERVDNDFLRGMVLNQLGLDALLSGDIDGARRHFVSSAGVHRQLLDLEGIAYCLEGFAGLALAQHRPEVGGRLLGAAARLRQIVGVAVWPLMRPMVGRLDQAARAALSSEQLDDSQAAGAAYSAEEALSYALEATAA